MRGDVSVRIVRSDGLEFRLGDNDWRIPNDGLENFATLTYDVAVSEVPSYDGGIFTAKRIASQDRTIKAEYQGSDREAARAAAIKFFNPKYDYECYVTYMGRTRHCVGEQYGFLCSTENIYKRPYITWTILCANPYMLSEGLFGEDISKIEPRFGFPWVSYAPPQPGEGERKTNVGAIASSREFSASVDILNDGDVPSGMKVKLHANGQVVNPMIRVGDKYVRVLYTMKRGDEIIMDASSRPPTVTLNGENAMQLLDRTSRILDMMIAVGDTSIEYDAASGYDRLHVTVYYKKQYLGV